LYFAGAMQYRAIIKSEDADVNLPSSILTTERSARFENLSHGTRYRFSVVVIGAQSQESEESLPAHRVIGKPEVTPF